MTDDDLSARFTELRRRAEELAQDADPAYLAADDAQQLIHELQVHQIELEIQNEELRVAQLDLENSRRKYRDLYEFSPVGLLTLDEHERVVEANVTLANLLGINVNTLIANYFSSFIDPASQDTYHFFFQGLKASGTPRQCEISLIQQDQTALFVRLDGIVMTLAGVPTTYRIAVSDLTSKQQADAKMLELFQERQRMKVLADFMRGTSHDLRTPITTIMTGLYLIGKSEDKAAQLKKIAEINVQLVQLTQALEQLQQMAVLNSTDRLDLRPDHIQRIIREVLQNLRQALDEKSIHLIVNAPDDLPRINLDAVLVYQALMNLLTNSLQFTLADGIISVTAYQEAESIIIQISDNGIGIEADMLPHIFEHFFKADEARSTRTGGVGLGLPMAKRIIELHHGTIEVHSTPNVNTTFRVCLPLNPMIRS